ncbi:MAG: LptF/LptG family permease [Longimicrobiales bacterium]
MIARILDRYVIAEFARIFVVASLAVPFLFILGDITDNLDSFQRQGLTGREIWLNYFYQLPLFVLYGLPIAALIATVFTVNAMTRHSEIAAAKASGVSFHRLFATLPLLGVLLTLAGLALAELVPIGNRLRREAIGDTEPVSAGRQDFVYSARDGQTYAIRRLTLASARITGIAVEREGNEPDVPGMQIVAQQAIYRPDERAWLFVNGYMRLFYGPGAERTMRFDQLRPLGFRETPEQLLAIPREPEDMGYNELGEFIEIIERSGGDPLDLKVERAQKIALPLATLVIILFAAPLATSSQRGGAAYGVGISLAITIVYLMLFKIAGAAGATGGLPPWTAAWLPNAVFAVAAGVLVVRVRT